MGRLKRHVGRMIAALVRRVSHVHYGDYYYSNRWHPHHALLQEALAETVAYIKTRMPNAMIKADAADVLRYAVSQVALDGLWLEFGVRTGTSINQLARLRPEAKIFGFDSFEGLPEAWSGWTHEKGTFGGEGKPRVESNVELVVGWFDDTLPKFLASHPGDLAFAHVDSDIYSSAVTVLTNLAPRIRPGTIIVFNEYFNYPNWQQHEFRAFQEFCNAADVDYEYLCWGMYEVAVRILSTRGPD